MMNTGELAVFTGEVVKKVDEVGYVKAETTEDAARAVGERKGTSCVTWEDDKIAEFDGTYVGSRIRELREGCAAWRESGVVDAVSYVFTHYVPTAGAGDVALLSDEALPQHSASPNCEWRIDEATKALSLHAITDILPHQPYTVSYGTEPTHYIFAKHGVETQGKNPHDRLELGFEVPPALLPALTPYFEDSAAAAAKAGVPAPAVVEDNVTKHSLTVDNPYPITLRLAARAHCGPESTEDSVDCCLEKLFIGMRDALHSKEAQQAAREVEFDILISSLSRLFHTTTLRKGGACHKILREPPTMRGETLTGVPLLKCLSLETALAMPDVTNGGLEQFMNEQQIRTLQIALMKGNVEGFLPSPEGIPLYWSDDDIAALKGTEAEELVASIRADCKKDFEAVRGLAINVNEETWKWAAAVVAKSTVVIDIPEENVRINIADGEAQPVTWEDEDGDRIKFRVEDGKLIYSVNGEDRPAIEKIEVVDGVSLRFPLIDREVDLVSPNHPNDAYRLVFSYIRALAEAAKVEHDIPKAMTFTKQRREVSVVIPGAAKLPHHPIANSMRYLDNAVWSTSCGGQGNEVTHIEKAGNAVLVARRGELATPNAYTCKKVVMKVPCRALGAEETVEDKKHGMMLQCVNLIAERCDEVEVVMPDLMELQSGADVSFTVVHNLTADKPVPKSLLWMTMISLISVDTIKANQHMAATIDGICSFLAEHGSAEKAAALITQQLDTLAQAYPTTLADDKTELAAMEGDSRKTLALRLRIEEKTILENARGMLEKLQAAH